MLLFILFIIFIVDICAYEKTKFCIDCKYFIKNENNLLLSKCGAFQKFQKSPFYFIAGNDFPLIECNPNAVVSRLLPNLCGSEGKYFQINDFNEENDEGPFYYE